MLLFLLFIEVKSGHVFFIDFDPCFAELKVRPIALAVLSKLLKIEEIPKPEKLSKRFFDTSVLP